MPTIETHHRAAAENLKALKYMTDRVEDFPQWCVAIAFYTALHVVEAVFAQDGVHCDSHTGLLAYNLLRGTMTESAKRNGVMPRQLSIKGTMQAVESFTPAMMAIDETDRLYDAFLAAVSARRVGLQPGRQEPRLKKRRPVWHDMMMKPRNEYFRRSASKADSLT